MLKAILKSIRNFLAAIPRFAIEKVWDGMRWVRRLVAVPQPPAEPEVEQAVTQSSGELQHVNAVRAVAAHLASRSIPPAEALARLGEKDLEWLTVLSKKMLCRVAVASDQALKAHIRRRQPMAGVLAYDAIAIKEFKAAVRRQRHYENSDEKLGFFAT